MSAVQVIEFVPLYVMLGIAGFIAIRQFWVNAKWRWPIQPSTSESEI